MCPQNPKIHVLEPKSKCRNIKYIVYFILIYLSLSFRNLYPQNNAKPSITPIPNIPIPFIYFLIISISLFFLSVLFFITKQPFSKSPNPRNLIEVTESPNSFSFLLLFSSMAIDEKLLQEPRPDTSDRPEFLSEALLDDLLDTEPPFPEDYLFRDEIDGAPPRDEDRPAVMDSVGKGLPCPDPASLDNKPGCSYHSTSFFSFSSRDYEPLSESSLTLQTAKPYPVVRSLGFLFFTRIK